MSVRRLPTVIVFAFINLVLFGTAIQQHAQNQKPADANAPVGPKESTTNSSPTASPFDRAALSDFGSLEFERKLVKGAPFSATLTIEVMQNLADGISATRTAVSQIYRDGEGRTRLDRMAEAHGATAPVSDRPLITTINDPVAGFSYVLDPGTNVARRTMFVSQFESASNDGSNQTGGVVSTRQRTLNSQVLPLPAANEMGQNLQHTAVAPYQYNLKRDSLGQRKIEGITAEGTRIAMTIPAGAMRNEKAVEIVAERWYSPTLKTVILIEHSDSGSGKSTYRLTNIKSGELLPSFFAVPSAYKIRE
jgi:hypothetical protein